MGSPFWWGETAGELHVAFTSAAAGNLGSHVGSDAEENRLRLQKQMGIAPGSLRFLNQVHSADVVDAEVPGVPTGDAWISREAHPALAVLVADCLPVLFSAVTSSGGRLTGAAHAGRPGLVAGILENTLEALRREGAEQLTAWIGPGACGSCYEVPAEMHRELTADRPALSSQTSWGTPALNLRAEAVRVLNAAGAEVVDVAGCTIEDPQLFSHRRSQRTGEPAGRIAGVIWS
ncbi:polyphenol oxidase family protein [Nesterenkonia sp.]|uniref:polyphenol oxidase family protein n=1 Tax=Nesterenkonia sp. TaxID=704201 RepID=UPI002604C60A|nr:polyphenol oxidase family protein [Nesterenkonia sp.]